jgi:hypothetical protein
MMLGEHAAHYGAGACLVLVSTKIALLTELGAVKMAKSASLPQRLQAAEMRHTE